MHTQNPDKITSEYVNGAFRITMLRECELDEYAEPKTSPPTADRSEPRSQVARLPPLVGTKVNPDKIAVGIVNGSFRLTTPE